MTSSVFEYCTLYLYKYMSYSVTVWTEVVSKQQCDKTYAFEPAVRSIDRRVGRTHSTTSTCVVGRCSVPLSNLSASLPILIRLSEPAADEVPLSERNQYLVLYRGIVDHEGSSQR